MRFKKNMFASLTSVVLGTVFALGFLAQAQAADPSGTWSWVVKGRQGGPDRKIVAKIKVDGDKLTGTVTAPGRNGETRDAEIKDGKVKGDEISFNTVREINGTKMTTKYSGKVTSDSIKGKMEFERNGEPVSRDWEAKRGEGAK